VFTAYGQFAITVVEQSASRQPGIHLEILVIQAVLDHDFPLACCTEDKLVVLSLHEFAYSLRQASGLARRTKRPMRI
jgi:hypothetical protein